MSPRAIRTGAEVAFVLGVAGLLLELVRSHSWAIILIAIAALLWMEATRQRH